MVVCNLSSLVLVLGFLIFASSCYAIPVKQIEKICRQTRKPALCLKVLKEKPNASLDGITEHTMKVARSSITNSITLIHNLIGAAKDPGAKHHYESCLRFFDSPNGALGDLNYCKELFHKRDYEGMNVAASGVVTDVEDCISGESPTDPPYPDPSNLPKYAAVVEAVIDIVLSLSHALRE